MGKLRRWYKRTAKKAVRTKQKVARPVAKSIFGKKLGSKIARAGRRSDEKLYSLGAKAFKNKTASSPIIPKPRVKPQIVERRIMPVTSSGGGGLSIIQKIINWLLS